MEKIVLTDTNLSFVFNGLSLQHDKLKTLRAENNTLLKDTCLVIPLKQSKRLLLPNLTAFSTIVNGKSTAAQKWQESVVGTLQSLCPNLNCGSATYELCGPGQFPYSSISLSSCPRVGTQEVLAITPVV